MHRHVTMNAESDSVTFEAAPVTLPQGLIGFPDFTEFGLINLPDPRMEQFKLLQSVSDPDLSFIVLPLQMEDSPIDAEDMNKALTELAIAPEDALILSIVTIRQDNGQVQITTNLKAPIIVDADSRNGRQYVFSDPKYDIRHALS